jgi:hypothetical protein
VERKENRDNALSLDDIIKEVREERKSAGQGTEGMKSASGTGIWKTEAFAQWKDELTEVEPEEEAVAASAVADDQEPQRMSRKT